MHKMHFAGVCTMHPIEHTAKSPTQTMDKLWDWESLQDKEGHQNSNKEGKRGIHRSSNLLSNNNGHWCRK